MKGRRAARRVLERMRVLIQLSDVTQRQLERRLGFSRGYLSQLLSGAIDIKLWQVLAILTELELEPADLFSELFPARPRRAPDSLGPLRRSGEQRPLSLELAELYGLGIESIEDLANRLERFEGVLEELSASGLLKEWRRSR